MNAAVKHFFHCVVFFTSLITAFYITLTFPLEASTAIQYSTFIIILSYVKTLLPCFGLAHSFFSCLGLFRYNAFKDEVKLKASPLLAPFVCFRVVTRGTFPQLVKKTLEFNMSLCHTAGMENFSFEVVTDLPLNLPEARRFREIVVPKNYRPPSGCMYKARALQYCLEPRVDNLAEGDWIVHLDEETLLTQEAIYGILNFCGEGTNDFGQGLITYASGPIYNWITTLADCMRVADDMGKLRASLRILGRPVFGWKGSFIVAKVSAERLVTYDHGMEGSIAEDCFFAMYAMRYNLTFAYIDGEMHECSAFSVTDYIQQRKRWLQGIWLTAHSNVIPLRHKALLVVSLYAWITMPLAIVLQILPIPNMHLRCIEFSTMFTVVVNTYMYLYGAWRSFSRRCRGNLPLLFCYSVLALMFIPFNLTMECIAALFAVFTPKTGFHIVEKSIASLGHQDVEAQKQQEQQPSSQDSSSDKSSDDTDDSAYLLKKTLLVHQV